VFLVWSNNTFILPWFLIVPAIFYASTNSTSKWRVAFGGIVGGAPFPP
jgi:hypothetical protein